MKTVNDLFVLDDLQNATVLAGHEGLVREVKLVNISDAPDSVRFLKPDHLLLTSGYGFKDDPSALCHLIEEMNTLGCSGLLIKIKRFLMRLPDEVLALADRLSFPIIDVPASLPMGEVSYHILNFLNDQKAETLHYALHVHREFSEMMMKGYSLPSLVEQLGYFLQRPVLLLNHRGEKLAQGHKFSKRPMVELETEILEKVNENFTEAQKGVTFDLQAETNRQITTYPIKTRRQSPSILIIVDALTLDYPASELGIKQVCNVISFTLIKEEAIEENSRVYKDHFFADLIKEKIHSKEEILSRCEEYGLRSDIKTVCIVCSLDCGEEEYPASLVKDSFGELNSLIYEQLEDELIREKMTSAIFRKESYFVVLLQFPHYTEVEMNHVKEFLENVQANYQGDCSISFGISNWVQSPTELPVVYREAVESLNNGYDLNLSGFNNFYKTRDIKELFSMIPKEHLTDFYENTMKSLSYPNSNEEEDLVKTIKVYCDSQCEISEASRRLFIHRNTVKYRIAKAEELLNCTFSDPSDSLRVRTAFVIRSLLTE